MTKNLRVQAHEQLLYFQVEMVSQGGAIYDHDLTFSRGQFCKVFVGEYARHSLEPKADPELTLGIIAGGDRRDAARPLRHKGEKRIEGFEPACEHAEALSSPAHRAGVSDLFGQKRQEGRY